MDNNLKWNLGAVEVTAAYLNNTQVYPVKPPNGIYIQNSDGTLYHTDSWNIYNSSLSARGIAVITDNCQFVLALFNANSSTYKWGGYNTTITDITTTTDIDLAKNDYDGEAQTDAILNQLGNSTIDAPAAAWCRKYPFPIYKSPDDDDPEFYYGYLGAAGEWQAVLDNKNDIDAAIELVDGDTLNSTYWTSTQYSSTSSWIMYLTLSKLQVQSKKNDMYIRAFGQLKWNGKII